MKATAAIETDSAIAAASPAASTICELWVAAATPSTTPSTFTSPSWAPRMISALLSPRR
ncbi:MAG: hypothetical protein QM723_08295 [Myxococcaceae bacterium]